MSANIHDDNPLPRICWERWNRCGHTWQEAVDEVATLMHFAVKLDDVRKLHQANVKAAKEGIK